MYKREHHRRDLEAVDMKIKIMLDEEDIPKRWYNVAADLPTPLDPPLNPGTLKTLNPSDMEPIFPKELIR
jgi:tryptophan synthase beta chain